MFSVYGVTGQSLRGSLEKLIAVPGLSAARRSHGIDEAPVLDRTFRLRALVNDPPLSPSA